MPLLDVSDITVAAGVTVTARHFNLSAEFSRQFCDFFQVEHRLVDVEHGALNIPVAAGYAQYSAGSYSWAGGTRENWESIITKNATGDITLTLTPDIRSAADWFVDVVPLARETGEPIFAVSYSVSQTTSACRIFLYYNNGGTPTACDRDFYIAAYGRRAVGVGGEGASSVAASGDVRNRISVNDVESSHHRNKLFTYYNTARTAFLAQHLDTGAHAAPSVPIGAFLVDTDMGSVIWSAGNISDVRYDLSSWITYRVNDGWTSDGARAMSTQSATAISLNNSAIPFITRPHSNEPRQYQILFDDAPNPIVRIGAVIYGRRAE